MRSTSLFVSAFVTALVNRHQSLSACMGTLLHGREMAMWRLSWMELGRGV